jgi:molybdenum cofactor synthesis domain-containing protein
MIRVAILTISDRSAAGERDDASGPAIEEAVRDLPSRVVATAIVPDERDLISAQLRDWADSDAADLIVTTGGTGFAERDIAPEATEDVLERRTPGLAEAMRAASFSITPFAMLSRATAGIRKRSLIVNLPGSPKAVIECLAVITPVLAHGVSILRGDSGDHG